MAANQVHHIVTRATASTNSDLQKQYEVGLLPHFLTSNFQRRAQWWKSVGR